MPSITHSLKNCLDNALIFTSKVGLRQIATIGLIEVSLVPLLSSPELGPTSFTTRSSFETTLVNPIRRGVPEVRIKKSGEKDASSKMANYIWVGRYGNCDPAPKIVGIYVNSPVRYVAQYFS